MVVLNLPGGLGRVLPLPWGVDAVQGEPEGPSSFAPAGCLGRSQMHPESGAGGGVARTPEVCSWAGPEPCPGLPKEPQAVTQGAEGE